MTNRLEQYRLEDRLEAPGGIERFRGQDERSGASVGVSMLAKPFLDIPDNREKFQSAAEAAVELEHRAIAPIHENGTAADTGISQPFVAHAAPEGIDLVDAIGHGMTVERCALIATALASALDHAHARGVLHGWIRPACVVLTEDDEPVLSGFGLPTDLEQDGDATVVETDTLSPVYSSPEQCKGFAADARSDLYSLGCVMVEMLTGAPPYSGGDTLALVAAHDSSPIPRLPARLDDWQPIIDRCMAKSPDDRFPTGAALVEAIDSLPAEALQPPADEVSPDDATVVQTQAPAPTTTLTIGRFEIEKKLGMGGMAVVYLGKDPQLDRYVAIKLMSPEMALEEEHRERFLQEARACAALSHPAVVPIFDVGVDESEDPPRPYFAMAHMPGGDLKRRIQSGLSEQQIIEIATSMAAALGHAHDKGFVHRDVKPGNILFDENDKAFLTDLGVVKALERDEELTVVGTIIGTPTYMSPEQCKGFKVDGRSDLYSLGCVIFEMLTGKPPFTAKSPLALVSAHDSSPVPELPEAFQHWQPIIECCMAKLPEERFSDGAALVAALTALGEGTLSLATVKAESGETTDDESSARRSPLVLGGIAAALLVGGIAFTQLGGGPGREVEGEVAEAASSPEAVTASAKANSAPEGSIAVLPFANLTQGETGGFFGDGIADTVTHVLSQVDDIQVIARTSSFAFKDKNMRMQDIAEALNVAHVLEGSVQQAGGKMRIIARLINAQSGAEVWSGYYDRGEDAIFEIQDEIAQEVATAMKVTVLGGEDVNLVAGYQPDLKAFEAYILGREALDKRSVAGSKEAYALFEKAIEVDPNYALAYVGLGQASVYLMDKDPEFPRQKVLTEFSKLAAKALDLDPLLPEAHVARSLQLNAMKQFEEAEAAAKRAIEISPSHAPAYDALRGVYYTQGRLDDALAAAKKATELDPEDNKLKSSLAFSLWTLGRSEAAISIVKNLIEREPRVPSNYNTLARYLRQTGHSGEALFWEDRALTLDPDNPRQQLSICQGLLQLWDEAGARKCLLKFVDDHPNDPEGIQYLATVNQDVALGISNARAQVEANPNFWYRKMQLVDWLTYADENEEAIGIIRDTFPQLFEDPPVVSALTIWTVQTLVKALTGVGEDAQALALTDVALEFLSMERQLQGSGMMTGTEDVWFLANRGDITEAVDSLARAIDRDWQFFSFGVAQEENWPADLWNDPRFQAEKERLAANMAEERAWYAENRERDNFEGF